MTDAKLAFNGERAYRHLKHLAVGIGPRLIGTAGEHEAAEYIGSQFKSYGLKTSLQKYSATTFDNRKTTFEILDNGKWRQVKCQPVMLTASTPPGGIEADLYHLESGSPEHFSKDLKGKIVLVSGGIPAQDRPALLSYGPRALVMIEGGFSRELARMNVGLGNRKTYGRFLPTARIFHRDGLDIVKKGIRRARLKMSLKEKTSHSFNVIGEKKGDEFPDEIVVICSHYDSSMGIRGACDNAAGTAVMLELARIFAAEPSRRTLRFIAFSGEETGLNGSRFYADELVKKAGREKKRKSFREKIDKTVSEKHRFTFNLDVHGFILGNNNAMFSGPEDIGAALRLLSRETGRVCGVSKAPMSSDGTALAAIGIPTVQLSRHGGGTELHTPLDDMDNLSAGGLAKGGEFAEMFMRRYITRSKAFPFAREIPDDQMKSIKEYFTNAHNPVPGEKTEPEKGKKS